MSVEDLANFIKVCAEDDSIGQKAKEIGIDNIEQQKEYARKLGYHWNEDDVQAYAKQLDTEGEMTDDDLENVAGGRAFSNFVKYRNPHGDGGTLY